MIKDYAKVIRAWLQKYERPLIAGSLITGFLFDSWWLTSVDVLWNDLILAGHLILAATGIAVFHIIEERKLSGWKANLISAVMPLVIQYSFGALFSGLIIFYGRSASVASSWIFVLILAAMVIFSETFSKNYRRFRYQITVWFLLLLAYNAFFLPVIIGEIGPWVFFLGVVVSLLILGIFLIFLQKILPNRILRTRKFLTTMTLGVATAFFALYSLNWIPPLPLALKEVSVAHKVVRTGDTYMLEVEPKSWWQWYATHSLDYHYKKGEAVYVYSSVFAPTKLDTEISHEWQHYSEENKEWEDRGAVTFPISGGRDGGYRGYSIKSNIEPGKWRVNVKTDYGAIVGRITFTAFLSDVDAETEIHEY